MYYISGSIIDIIDYHSWIYITTHFQYRSKCLLEKIRHFHTNKTFGLQPSMENSKVQLL